MKEWTGTYVAHYCRRCDDIFIAEDYTRAKNNPPRWRYCPKCAKELGINYEQQTPRKNRTVEEQEKIDKFASLGGARRKYQKD